MLSAPLRCLEVIIFCDTSKRCNKSKQTSLWSGSGAVPDFIPPKCMQVNSARGKSMAEANGQWLVSSEEFGTRILLKLAFKWLEPNWIIERSQGLETSWAEVLFWNFQCFRFLFWWENEKLFSLQIGICCLYIVAKHWDRKARGQSKGKPRDRDWEPEMSQMFWIWVKKRGESCESSCKTLEGVERPLWFMDPLG